MTFVPDAIWDQYKNIINEFHYDAFQADITWRRSIGGIDRNGEDNSTERFTNITLKGLYQYNNTRIWPITRFTESGLLDKQSEVILLNVKYLDELGYINSNGNFEYQQDTDRFIHNGILYKAVGDTLISQAKDTPLLIMIILSRETISTGNLSN